MTIPPEDETPLLEPAERGTGDWDAYYQAGNDSFVLNSERVVQANMGPRIYINTAKQAEAADGTLQDPTISFHRRTRDDLASDFETADVYEKTLRRRRMLFLSCPDTTVRDGATLSIDRRFRGSGLEDATSRLLSFRQLADQELSLRSVLESEHEWKKPTLLIAEADCEEAHHFLFSVVASASATLSLLEDHKVYLLVLTNEHWLTQVGRKEAPRAEYDISLPFIEPQLRKPFGTRSAELAAELESRWKTRQDDPSGEIFLGQLLRLIDCPKTVSKVATGEQSIGDAFDHVLVDERHRASELLGGAHSIDKAVLLVAAFLPGISPEEFRVALGWLVPPQQDSASDYGELYSPRGWTLSEWDRSYAEVFRRCSLRISAGSNIEGGNPLLGIDEGARRIHFEHSIIRRQVAQAFLTDYYFDFLQLSERLLAEGWPGRLDKALRLGLMDLVIARSKIDPIRHGVEFLLMLALRGGILGSEEARGPGPTDQEIRGWLATILRRMLRQESLRGVVDRFLNELLYRRQLKWVSALVAQLRTHDGFDTGYWWRQLIERAPQEERGQRTREIDRLLRNPTYRQTTLTILVGWLETGAPGQQAWWIAFRKILGPYPKADPWALLGSCDDTEAEYRARVLVRTLFHRDVSNAAIGKWKTTNLVEEPRRSRSLAEVWIRYWLQRGKVGGLPQSWKEKPLQIVDRWLAERGEMQQLGKPETPTRELVGDLCRAIVLGTWAASLRAEAPVDAAQEQGEARWKLVVRELGESTRSFQLEALLAIWRFLQTETSELCDLALASDHDFLREKLAPELYSKSMILGRIGNDLRKKRGTND